MKGYGYSSREINYVRTVFKEANSLALEIFSILGVFLIFEGVQKLGKLPTALSTLV